MLSWRGFQQRKDFTESSRGLSIGKECCQLCSCPKLRYWIKLLKSRCESVLERPCSSRSKFLDGGLKIVAVYISCKMASDVEVSLDERAVNYHAGAYVAQLGFAPAFNSLDHRCKISLHLVNAD